jgi:uncharacterized protein (TIRG00374 family)
LALKLRGALLGAGNIALRSHAPGWAGDEQLRQEIEIVAVADLASTNLAAVREWLPDARPYTDAKELLEREALDFCDICTPPATHLSLIENAASRGVHVICEKPLAPTLAEAGHIANAVRRARIVFRPCHQYHYSPQWRKVRDLLPRLGQLRFAEYQVSRVGANPGNPNWSPAWRTERSMAGGGILVDHGAHILYQLRGVLGDPVMIQAFVARLLDPAYDVEDTALVTLDYGDHLAQLSLTWAARRRAIQFRFVGDRGELTGDEQRLVIHAARTEVVEFEEGLSKNSSHAGWYTPLLREFSAQAREGRFDAEPLDEAMYVTRVIERAYESARLGRNLPLVPAGESIAWPDQLASDRPYTESLVAADAERMEAPRPVEIGADAPHGAERAPTRRWLTHALLRVIGLLALVVIGFLAFRRIKWPEFWIALEGSDPRWLAAAAVLNLGVVCLAATRWFLLLRPLSLRPRWRDAFEASVVGFAVSLLVPARGGEVARAGLMARKTGMSVAEVVGTIGLDQLLNATGFIVALAFLPWLGAGVPLWIRPGAMMALALFAAAITALVAWWPARQPIRSMPRTEPERGMAGLLERVRQGMRAVRSPRAIGRALGTSFAAWALEILVLIAGLRAVGIRLSVPAVVALLIAINVMLAMPVTPGNLGTLELGATLGLLGFGVPREKALAFAVCYHALQSLPVAAMGFAVAAGEGLRITSTDHAV